MTTTKSIKNHSFCDRHTCFHQSNVCTHIKSSLQSESPSLILVPVFLERIIIEKYYAQYWLCENCAKKFDIASEGEIYYDPKLRELLNDDDNHEEDDELQVKLKKNLEGLFYRVCLDCFNEKYSYQADIFRRATKDFKKISIRD